MLNKLIWNDVRQNKLLSAATVFFMAVSAMMLALTALLFSGLLGSVKGKRARCLLFLLRRSHSAWTAGNAARKTECGRRCLLFEGNRSPRSPQKAPKSRRLD